MLAGSGYKPMTMKHADGREIAIAQFWSHNLTDTSLRPYNAMFIIVAAVRDDTPADRACIKADENGASSVLSMFDGCFDPDNGGIREPKRRLFYVRLLDSTRVAIEVGRERMGTDKRPGTIDLTREGKRLAVLGQRRRRTLVAKINCRHRQTIAQRLPAPRWRGQRRPRGSPFRDVSLWNRIRLPERRTHRPGPVVNWQWRTDVLPRLQPVKPNTVIFDSSSEEGEMLIRWGFKPKVLGYIPNVRGVVTGVPEGTSPRNCRVRIKDAEGGRGAAPRGGRVRADG